LNEFKKSISNRADAMPPGTEISRDHMVAIINLGASVARSMWDDAGPLHNATPRGIR